MVKSHCLLIVISLTFPLHSTGAQKADSPNDRFSLHVTENEETTNLRSWKAQTVEHHRHHLRNVHGMLVIIGWGSLMPAGVILATCFERFPVKSDEWFDLHVLCQTLGYTVGAIGWIIGISLANSSSEQHSSTSKTHTLLGIVTFIFATLQMLGLFLQHKRDQDERRRRWWKICHQLVGFALIAMIIGSIFGGLENEGNGGKWRWGYVGILGVLATLAVVLEIFRWVKPRMHQQMRFDDNAHNSVSIDHHEDV